MNHHPFRGYPKGLARSTLKGKCHPVSGSSRGQAVDLFEHVGGRIRDLRLAYGGGEGLSQEALAKALGVATNTISRWETATYHPSLKDLDKLARFFGASILTFFPPERRPADERMTALLRAAEQLSPDD